MPSTLYLNTWASMGTRLDADYYALPAHLRRLADAASGMRGAYVALSEACREARRLCAAPAAVEALDAAELTQWNAWQHMERQAAALLDAGSAQAGANASGAPSLAAQTAQPIGGVA